MWNNALNVYFYQLSTTRAYIKVRYLFRVQISTWLYMFFIRYLPPAGGRLRQPATIEPTLDLCTRYPLRLVGLRQCGIWSLPGTSTYGQHWESNPRPSFCNDYHWPTCNSLQELWTVDCRIILEQMLTTLTTILTNFSSTCQPLIRAHQWSRQGLQVFYVGGTCYFWFRHIGVHFSFWYEVWYNNVVCDYKTQSFDNYRYHHKN